MDSAFLKPFSRFLPKNFSVLRQQLVVFALSFFATANLLAAKPAAGLAVTFSNSDQTDAAVAPNVWLFVPSGQPPTPFLEAGKFVATWRGYLTTQTRGDFAFGAELNGALRIEINGQLALDRVGTNSTFAPTKFIRLNRGTNEIVATFRSPENGDASVRLEWKPKGSFAQPIPSAALSHFPNAKEIAATKLRLGRELFVEHRCAKCHVTEVSKSAIPELAMDAPSFEEIGSRRNVVWLSGWIANPKTWRASTRMPQIFDGKTAVKNAEDIADFLSSLVTANAKEKTDSTSKPQEGRRLFAMLNCVACHLDPEKNESNPAKISLKKVAAKFAPGALAEFLKNPSAHYAWIRMPRFKLSDEQRDFLVAYLLSKSEKGFQRHEPIPSENIERGRKLVQTSGCLNCHSLKLQNEFSTKSLAQITSWKTGCLAAERDEKSSAPWFAFSAEEREALQLFYATDRGSLNRHVPAEFAERQVRELNCAECHSKIEGVPRVEILGGKLKPEWTAKFIGGEISYKPRPWIAAQMPAFASRAELLAEGLAAQHGLPSHSPKEEAPNSEQIEAGRKLLSASPIGFSCVSCHAVGKSEAALALESPGINLAYSGERLLPEFFKRWVRNPQLIDPLTKMPVYFDDDGNSPLTDILNGDGAKQIDALWQYVRYGDKTKNPPQL